MNVFVALVVSAALALGAAVPAGATFPGRRGRLAFSRPAGDTGFQIFTMRPRGGDVTQLTYEGYNQEPQWSPDGAELAWACRTEDGAEDDVCLMKADGSDRRRLYLAGNERSPLFDPSGRYLAFVGSAAPLDLTNEIFVRELETAAVRRVTLNDMAEVDLTWSPDGTTIAFVALTRERDFELYAVDVATGEQRTILAGEEMVVGDVDWSPGGRRLVYRKRVGNPNASVDELFTIRPDGTRERQITTGAAVPVFTPVWSPSGRRIAFGYGEGDSKTCIFDAAEVLDLRDHPLDARCSRGERFDLSWQPRPPE